jgi:hypothetical protein
MRRTIALGILIAIGTVSGSLRGMQARAQGPAPGQLTVEKLRDNLYILKTADPANESGGNTAVFIQSNGVTVVDTKNRGGARRFSPDQGAHAEAGDDDHQHARAW